MKKLLAISVLITLTSLFLSVFPNQHKEKHFAGRAEYAVQDTQGYYSKADVETRGRAEFA
ncbi:hypothetical protein P8917_09980 [Bacillus atrophaeus]|uniref:hypothetical protein n=1 Tax=Bacillus atrophaeus TaxID=1452 RepID=UPI00227DF5C1|nr:hypothetical protein [Bacillus atrophaeus]MCY8497771.1 hypothetical protein [Bacillus atrophaeus]MCY8814924.1 hypothetical protein [Bacillus atrophaeus]MCY8821574.1 hypothetical protein [Bacillus atrophaeus]MCY8831004.1 hypothetical protein [Bacillus atrophaeus]MCY8835219.1 hypothetical protein [Bacillus atrophaeus]